MNSGLQLEDLPLRNLAIDKETKKVKVVKDYSSLYPVLTIIWMVDDRLNFEEDYVSFVMTPEQAVEFIRDEKLWQNPEIVEIIEEREKVLKLLSNKTKKLDFLPKNRREIFKDGKFEGKIEEKIETAGIMLTDGVEIGLVARYTGLPFDEIRMLKMKLDLGDITPK